MNELQEQFIGLLEVLILKFKLSGLTDRDMLILVRLQSKNMYNDYTGSESLSEIDNIAIKLNK